MDPNVLLVLLILFILVVGVNGLLIFTLRRGRGSTHIRLWRQVGRRARNPWEKEDQDLKELSKRVEQFKEPDK